MANTHKTGFLNVSTEECSILYVEVQRNAENHFQCAALLAEGGQYSNAIAHLILGAEELIKATALLLESKGFQLRKVEGYKKLFSNHQARHSIIKEFHSVTLFIKSIITFLKKKKDKPWFLEAIELVATGLAGAQDAISNHAWWDKADVFKQNCFYVDYSNEVLHPERFQEKDFNEAYNFVMAFREDSRSLIICLENISEKDLTELRENFQTANLPGLLGETIQRSSAKK